MPWVYQQATGHLFINTIFAGLGYSGHGNGLNNPTAQDQHNVGPIPAGSYTIGAAHTPIDHLGPLALPLYPDPTNQMFGRFGFFMHGDNQYSNQSASDGCIIMSPDIRLQVTSSGEKTLVVVSGLPTQRVGSTPTLASLTTTNVSDVSFSSGPINYYPELPVLPYEQTSVSMDDVVHALNASTKPVEVRRASYVIFRNESGNGAKGINNNYIGAQADSGRWKEAPAEGFAGTVTYKENGTGRLRIFLAFKTLIGNLEFLTDKVLDRGLYVGGKTHLVVIMDVDSEQSLARAYYKEWVTGSVTAEPSVTNSNSFLSMYHQAKTLII